MKKSVISFFVFFLLFGLIFFPSIHGIGQYWDWSFPYYKDLFKNIFYFKSLAWNGTNLGSTLGYSSDYYLRFFLSLLPFEPEINIYLYLVSVMSIGATFLYSMFSEKQNRMIAFLIGAAAYLNPAICYKVLAGHYLYCTSYTLFIVLIYFTLFHFKNSFRSYVILAFIISFIGFQIQFFIFSMIYLCIYFLFFSNKFRLPYLMIALVIIGGINSVWLMNFVTGANNIVAVSNKAGSVSFDESKYTSLEKILKLEFSRATQIQNVYPSRILLISSLLFIFVFIFLSTYRNTQHKRVFVVMFLNLIVFLSLATGFYHRYQLWPLRLIYPMVREVGHYAALVILFSLILIKLGFSGSSRRVSKIIFGIYISIFCVLNAYIFIQYQPSLDFSRVRVLFSSYKHILDQDKTEYRILSYPFFNQYSFIQKEIKVKNGSLLSNTGQDNFVIFSGHDYVEQSIPPQLFQSSIPYRFIKSGYDVEILKPYNIKYIFDFSPIYESHVQNYISAETYEYNIKNVKKDPFFMEKILKKNGGKVKKLNEHVFEIVDVMPRMEGGKIKASRIDKTKMRIKLMGISKGQEITFQENFHKGWHLYLRKNNDFISDVLQYQNSKPVFENTHTMVNGYANQWTIDPSYIKKNFSKEYYKENPDGSIDVELTLYFKPQSYFYLGLVVSGLTFAGCIGYLIFDFIQSRRARTTAAVVQGQL